MNRYRQCMERCGKEDPRANKPWICLDCAKRNRRVLESQGNRCPVCDRNNKLFLDMEDGVHKCYDCCGMPPC